MHVHPKPAESLEPAGLAQLRHFLDSGMELPSSHPLEKALMFFATLLTFPQFLLYWG
jgi:hypothetical protein